MLFFIWVHQKEKRNVHYKASSMSKIMIIIWNKPTAKVHRAVSVNGNGSLSSLLSSKNITFPTNEPSASV